MVSVDEFIRACKDGKIDVLRQYIADGGNINVTGLHEYTDEWTGLMWAAYFGNLDCIRELLNAGADINYTDKHGVSALRITTAKWGRIDCMRALIGAGADVNAGTLIGWTLLMSAFENNHYAQAQLLIESGADIYSKDIYGRPAIDYCKDKAVKGELILMYNTMTAIKSSESPVLIQGFDTEL